VGQAIETPAGFLAIVFGHEGRPLPMALGASRKEARALGMRQFAGCSAGLRSHYAQRMRTIGLDADEASAWAEWMAAPWDGAA
jgi:hypothetical protein